MFFAANRLGFFFKQINRSYKKKILCFYDPLTNGPGGVTNYYSGPDKKPDSDLYPVIESRGISLDYEVDLISSYSALNSTDLSQYSQLWDLGYASPYITNPDNPTTRLTQYIQSGGALFLLGENSSFQPRDNAIGQFVSSLGGGSGIAEGAIDFNYSRTLTIKNEFLLDNANSQVTFARPGVFTSFGNGTPMTVQGFPFTGELHYPAVMWKSGSLTVAPIGAVISILDLNFIVGVYQNLDFVDNLIASLNTL